MLGKRGKWVPYPPLKTILRTLLRTRNIRVDSNPSTRENRDGAAPNNIPDRAITREDIACVRVEFGTVERWDWAGADRVSQVVAEKDEKEHFGWVKWDSGPMRHLLWE